MRPSRSEIAYGEAMEKLFTAQWNIPQAAAAIGKSASEESWEETKKLFREYCASHPPAVFNAVESLPTQENNIL